MNSDHAEAGSWACGMKEGEVRGGMRMPVATRGSHRLAA